MRSLDEALAPSYGVPIAEFLFNAGRFALIARR